MDFSYSSSVCLFWTRLIIVLSVLVATNASSENAKTVEFNVKPGGVVHSFTEKICHVFSEIATSQLLIGQEAGFQDLVLIDHLKCDVMGKKEYECTFTYASQGGTNEQWQMSVGLSDDDRLFSCSVWRPQGKSYLFFTQFKAEIKGSTIEFASAYSQAAVGGLKDVALKEEEYIIGDTTVTHKDGKFQAELSKLTIIGRTRHDEL